MSIRSTGASQAADELSAELEETPNADKPPRRAVRPRASATGKVTIQYPVDKEELNHELENENETTNGNRPLSFSDLQSARETPFTANVPQNRLADMFAELADAQEYDGQQFYCFLIRKPDFANDKYRRRALAAENFQPFPITAQSVLDFIPTIQEINGNSGGRFEVRIADERGQDTGIGMAGLVITDPVIAEKTAPGAASDLSVILEMMQKEREESNKKFELLLSEMNKPKPESDLEKALKQKVINDILNPPERNSKFDPGEMVATIFTTSGMISAMSDQFANAMKKNDPAPESTLDKILGNEMLMSKAQDVANNFAQTLQMIVAARQQQAQNPGAPQPPPQGYPPIAPPPPPQQPTVTPEQEAEVQREQMELINKIITELESDTPITLDNAMLVELRDKYPPIYQQLVLGCQFTPFETILEQLEAMSPDTFDQFYSETGEVDEETKEPILDFNERGKKIESRLRELYDLLKTVTL